MGKHKPEAKETRELSEELLDHGICGDCGDAFAHLLATENGHYLCPDCYDYWKEFEALMDASPEEEA